MTLAPTLPTSEYTVIIQQAIFEINSSIERHNRAANAHNLSRPDLPRHYHSKPMNREQINKLIARTCRAYGVKESYIRRIGHFEKIEEL